MSSTDNSSKTIYVLPDIVQLPLTLTPEAAGKLCGLPLKTVYWLARSGDWKSFSFKYGGGAILIRTAGLLQWLAVDGGPHDHSTENAQEPGQAPTL